MEEKNPEIKKDIDQKLREKLGIFDGDIEETEESEEATPNLFDEE